MCLRLHTGLCDACCLQLLLKSHQRRLVQLMSAYQPSMSTSARSCVMPSAAWLRLWPQSLFHYPGFVRRGVVRPSRDLRRRPSNAIAINRPLARLRACLTSRQSSH